MADYQLILQSPYGATQKVIDDFISLDYARRVNTIGACTLVLPPRYSRDDFPRDAILLVMRRASGGPFSLECETGWFVQTVQWVKQSDGGMALQVVAADAVDLLRRRIVAYPSDSAQGNKATPTCADDLMKDIVSENFGSLALEDVMLSGAGLDDMSVSGVYSGGGKLLYVVKIDAIGAPDTFKWSDDGGATWDATGVAVTGGAQLLNNGISVTFAATTGHTLNTQWSWFEPSARDWSSRINIQGDLSDGPLVTKQCAWRNVLTTLQELAKASAEAGVWMAFDMVCEFGQKVDFRTFTTCRGVDHRYSAAVPVVISDARGQLQADAVLSYDWSGEATYAYVGGQGQGSTRPVRSAYDQARVGRSPFGRIEAWGEVQSTDGAAGGIIELEAKYLLESMRPRIGIAGRIQDIPGCMYGAHYGYGDYVTVEFIERLDCRLDMVHVTVQGGQETIEVELKSSEE